jgi:hypothetical protein
MELSTELKTHLDDLSEVLDSELPELNTKLTQLNLAIIKQ